MNNSQGSAEQKTVEEILRQSKYSSLTNLVLICEAMEEYTSQQCSALKEEMETMTRKHKNQAETIRGFQSGLSLFLDGRICGFFSDAEPHLKKMKEENERLKKLNDLLQVKADKKENMFARASAECGGLYAEIERLKAELKAASDLANNLTTANLDLIRKNEELYKKAYAT